jgi:hypothetical protein
MGAEQFASQVDNTFTGNTLETSITANTSNQYDADISNADASTTFETGEQNISGASEIGCGFNSNDGNTFDVVVEWTDGAGTVRHTQRPDKLQGITDEEAVIVVKSTHFNLKLEGNSSDVDGTVNAH